MLTIADICDTIGGGTPSTQCTIYYENGDISWATPTDVTNNLGIYLPSVAKYITKEGLSNSSAKIVPAYSILMTSRASVGYFAVSTSPICTNQGFISCVPYVENYRWLLLHNLGSRVEEIRALAGGSTYLEISKSTFRAMNIFVPTNHLLEAFAKITEALFQQEVTCRDVIVATQEARDRLLPKLMSGEIEVQP